MTGNYLAADGWLVGRHPKQFHSVVIPIPVPNSLEPVSSYSMADGMQS